MNIKKIEDVKDTAIKLDKIRSCRPEQFYYIKKYIQCLLNRGEMGVQISAKDIQKEKISKVDSQTL